MKLNDDEMYYVIRPTEDGEVYVEEMSKDLLLKRIHEKWWGAAKFVGRMPVGNDPRGWEDNTIVVIKGRVVSPKPVEVVTKFDIV